MTSSSGAAPSHHVPGRPIDSDTVPESGLDTSRPNMARVYNYGLGGKDNY
jgi:hypothetical protein